MLNFSSQLKKVFKRTFILTLFVFILPTYSFSQVHLTEGFEGTFTPAGWTKFRGANGLGTLNDWTTNATSYTGTKCAYINYENVTGGNAQDWLVTSQVNLSGNGNKLDFYMRQGYASDYGSIYTIRVSTLSQTNISDFTIIKTWNETDFGTTYGFQSVDLSAYDGQNVYIAFVMENDDGDSWRIDDITVWAPANMSYISSTTTQNNTSITSPGDNNQEIIGIEIVTLNTGNPFDLTQFQLNMNGSTNGSADVSNIDIYYTGTSNTFATTTLYGSASPSGGTINVNGTQTLVEGTNYFWVVYDIAGGATLLNYVDAECTQITMNGGIGNKTPSSTAPTGKRLIDILTIYLMDNTPVNTCGGVFYDSGGLSSDYALNENYTKTFCSDNGDNIVIDFTSFELDDLYDWLYIYDGPNSSSPLIGSYTSSTPLEAILSSGTCLTFKFVSDNYYNYSGWEANIYCVTMPTCGSNPVANDFCGSATYINNLDGYCGNTSGTYTQDQPGNLYDEFCGTIENNSWVTFTADSTTASFNVWTDNCLNGSGIQIEIYETADCNTFTSVSNCWNPFSEENGVVTATGLTIGQDYYMMIDGNGGDICDFIIGASQGVVVLPITLSKFEVICNNGLTELEWTTSSETNNDYFIIQRSENGKNFEDIDIVNGAGNSAIELNYSLVDDASLNNDISYYRLKQVDFNGKFAYSNIVASSCYDVNSSAATIYPNPAQNYFTFTYTNSNKFRSNLHVFITNTIGEIVLQKSFSSAPYLKENINIESLNNGIYHVMFTSSSTQEIHKLIINK
ncbi:MAG: choice-of-anchor J domain-containing protein [Flavobacteriales bacterium]|nr:choice-of-anchor J domain-containing protein [Flavobacteriales bacterium]MCB9363425.1 choice-of-anchor J domain-containing protein [Flavobacteriales bacterium]